MTISVAIIPLPRGSDTNPRQAQLVIIAKPGAASSHASSFYAASTWLKQPHVVRPDWQPVQAIGRRAHAMRTVWMKTAKDDRRPFANWPLRAPWRQALLGRNARNMRRSRRRPRNGQQDRKQRLSIRRLSPQPKDGQRFRRRTKLRTNRKPDKGDGAGRT